MKKWKLCEIGGGWGVGGVVILSIYGIYVLWKQKKFQYLTNHDEMRDKDIFELVNEINCDKQLIIEKLKENPLLVRSYDRKGRLPLHVELSKPIPDRELVTLLLELYPESAQIKDRFWQALPLHFCVHKDRADHVDLDLIRIVYETYPEATSITDGANFLPIHRAVNRVLPHPDIIEFLINADPDSVTRQTSNGNTCLHWLVSQPFPRTSEDIDILEKIVAGHPVAIFTRNSDKKTPLEILISKAAAEEAELVEGSKNMYGARYVLGHLIELSQTIK